MNFDRSADYGTAPWLSFSQRIPHSITIAKPDNNNNIFLCNIFTPPQMARTLPSSVDDAIAQSQFQTFATFAALL
jgi:hypothetical protein